MVLVKLELREISWDAIFECIRNSEICSKGSFWAGVQSLESQLKEYKLIRDAVAIGGISRKVKLDEFKGKLYGLLDEYGFVESIKINWKNKKDGKIKN